MNTNASDSSQGIFGGVSNIIKNLKETKEINMLVKQRLIQTKKAGKAGSKSSKNKGKKSAAGGSKAKKKKGSKKRASGSKAKGTKKMFVAQICRKGQWSNLIITYRKLYHKVVLHTGRS